MERTEQDSRWNGFSDEELYTLRSGASERHQAMALPARLREQAGRLATELRHEMCERARRLNYRGPGVYETRSGSRYEVLGTVGDPAVMGAGARVVMRNDDSDILMLELLSDFNAVDDREGTAHWRYVEPLEGS